MQQVVPTKRRRAFMPATIASAVSSFPLGTAEIVYSADDAKLRVGNGAKLGGLDLAPNLIFQTVNDGITSAVALLAAHDGLPYVIPAGRYLIDAAVAITSDIRLDPGAVFVRGAGGSLDFRGAFDAPIAKCFEGFPFGSVNLRLARIDWGYAEWFGASRLAIDNADALQMAWKACRKVRHLGYDYHVKRRLNYNVPFTQAECTGWRADGEGQATRFILDADAVGAGTDDVIVAGLKVQPTPGSTAGFIEGLKIKGIQAVRAAPCVPHSSGDPANYPTGWRINCVIRSEFENLGSRESSVGFYHGLTVATQIIRGLSERYNQGTTTTGDLTRGQFIDGRGTMGFAGGNASLYLEDCSHVGQPPIAGDAWGIEARGAFVDCSADHFETAQIKNGFLLNADASTTVGQVVDFTAWAPRLDGVTGTGIEVRLNSAPMASIRILDYYVECNAGGAQYGVYVHGGNGGVKTEGQIVCEGGGDFANGALVIANTEAVTDDSQIIDSGKPVILASVEGIRLNSQIHLPNTVSTNWAVSGTGVQRSRITPSLQAINGQVAGAVDLDQASRYNLIDLSEVNPSGLAADSSANKLRWDNTLITSRGDFGDTGFENHYAGIVL